MKKRIIYITIAIILSITEIFAQGGSSYSVYGIGDINPVVAASGNALAGTQTAFPSDVSINTKNPALWSYVTTTRLQAGYTFNQNFIFSDKYSLYQNNGRISGILGLFAIDTSLGLAISFGINPYSNVNYKLKADFTVNADDLSLSGQTLYQGSGGLSTGFIGASMKLFDRLAVGGEIFGDFGSIISTDATTVYGANSYVSGNSKEDDFYGYGFKLGLYYNIYAGLSVGAFSEIHSSLKYDRAITYISTTLTDTTFRQTNSLKMPPVYGFGLSYSFKNVIVGADFTTQDFTGFNYQLGDMASLGKSSGFSLGISKLGDKSNYGSYFNKITYNLGFSYKQLYYIVKNQNINEYYGSLGFEIPISGDAMLNWSLQLGSRGTTNNGLLKENFGRLVIDLSIGESWFKPFKREY